MFPSVDRSPSRADVILALMGSVLLGSVGGGVVSTLPVRLTAVGGSLLATVGLVDGLAIHPPVENE